MNTSSQGQPSRRRFVNALLLTCLLAGVYGSIPLDATLPVAERRLQSGSPPHERLVARADPGADFSIAGPGSTTVECDGHGNVEEREAWLADFVSASTCGALSSHQARHEGQLRDRRSFDMCELSMFQRNGSSQSLANPMMSGEHCALHLTDGTAQAGSAFLHEALSLAGSASFSVNFTFRISEDYPCAPLDVDAADGLVFVVAADPTSLGEHGGQLGYGGIANSLGVEFDTYNNGGMDGNMSNQAGINVSGRVDGVPRVQADEPFNNREVWFVWVDYDGASQILDVRFSPTADRPPAPDMSTSLDLVAELGTSEAYFGFSSGTGCAGGSHEILSLDLATVLPGSVSDCGSSHETVIYTAGDGCGNAGSHAAVFHVEDSTGPELSPGLLAPCHDDARAAEEAALAATGVDERCSGLVSVSAAASGTCEAVVWVKAVDACGNVSKLSYDTRISQGPPRLVGVPADGDAGCGSVPGPADVQAVSGCGGVQDVVFVERRHAGDDEGDYALERIWSATDGCGNVVSATQRIRVSDTEPPRLDAALLPLSLVDEPLPPGGGTSSCSAPQRRRFEVSCAAGDGCDPSPSLGAELLTRLEVAAGKHLRPVDHFESREVSCGEIIELELLAEACPGKAPRSRQSAFSPTADGTLLARAQGILLRARAGDASGNETVRTVGPNDGLLRPVLTPQRSCR